MALVNGMSSRIELYEVRSGGFRDNDFVCIASNQFAFGRENPHEGFVRLLSGDWLSDMRSVYQSGRTVSRDGLFLRENGTGSFFVKLFSPNAGYVAAEIRCAIPAGQAQETAKSTQAQAKSAAVGLSRDWGEISGSDQILQMVLDGVDGILAVRDRNARFVYANASYAQIMGLRPEQLIGKPIFDFFSPELAVQYMREDQEVFKSGESAFYEETVRNVTGELRNYLMRKSIVRVGEDQAPCVCVFALDITERKKIERELGKSNERYEQLFTSILDGFSLHEIILDGEGKPVDYRFLEVNPAFERMTGLKSSQIIGKTVREVLPDIEQFWIDAYGRVALTGVELRFENYAAPLKKYFSVLAFSMQKGQFAVLSSDITARKTMELALSAEKEKLRITLKSIGDGVITTDESGRVEMLNAAAEGLTGWRAAEAKGRSLQEVFEIFDESTGKSTENPVEKALRQRQIVELANHTVLRAKNGSVRSIADSAAPILDEDGELLGAVLVFRDVTIERKRNERIAFLSYHDSLTGIHNRNYLEDKLSEVELRFRRPLAVIMGDVNGLKLTNDIFGHAEGDKLLKTVAEVMQKNKREEDILVRWAGDEFLMILPRASQSEAARVCDRIIGELDRYDIAAAGIATPPSISLGYAIAEETDTDLTQAIKAAEDLMYKNKLVESRSAHSKIILALKKSLYEKSSETEEHVLRVADYCCKIGELLHLRAEEIDELHLLALMHDIGKITISETILNKPAELDASEWQEIKRHPEVGYRICRCTAEFRSISEYVLTHHERWDGSGYGQGLREEQIPLLSRILAVADAYEAMTSERPFRPARTKREAMAELLRCAGTQFDPKIVSIFLHQVLEK